MPHPIDEAFLALPLRRLADAALQRCRELGVEHADFRLERLHDQHISLHDGRLEGSGEGDEAGIGVRVVYEGTWGFAGTADLTPEAAVRIAELAVDVAKVTRPVNTERVELADEPAHGDVTWVSAYDVDPFTVPMPDKITLLESWSRRVLDDERVDHVDAHLLQVVENKFYADLAGTVTTQQRVRSHRRAAGSSRRGRSCW